MTIETSVLQRYSQGAQARQEELCCPVDYDRELLNLLPPEIVAKDYGCGDPSRYVREGDTVLDLGSGSGKICYMAAYLAGEKGRVIGVDMNDDMLALARKYQAEMAQKFGSDRVQFLKGQIQDLALDLTAMDRYLEEHPVHKAADVIALHEWQERQRRERPLIAGDSVDLVVSNCVLNLVHDSDKQQMVKEIYRVVKPGGRIAISDIVCDEEVPEHLKKDTALWSGCISGALQEYDFLQSFVDAGFVGVAYDKWGDTPWQVVEGLEFRSATIAAVKPKDQACVDKGHAVIYRGPFAEVSDDEGYIYPRGLRVAVCERSFRLLTSGVYKDAFIGIAPAVPKTPKPWRPEQGVLKLRPASETKGAIHRDNKSASCCE